MLSVKLPVSEKMENANCELYLEEDFFIHWETE